jgi:uncharacterized protein (DUF2147 family)
MSVRAIALSLLAGVVASLAPVAATALEGTVWRTASGSGHVRLETCGANLCGTIVQIFPAANREALDANNRDAALRSRRIMGMRILTGFTAPDRGAWRGGRIYNPEDGRTYRSELRLMPDGRLQVKGCFGPVCQDQYWTPAR